MADFEVGSNLDLTGNQIKNGGFEVVTSLPTANNFVGRRVTFNNKDYIWNGTEWESNRNWLSVYIDNATPYTYAKLFTVNNPHQNIELNLRPLDYYDYDPTPVNYLISFAHNRVVINKLTSNPIIGLHYNLYIKKINVSTFEIYVDVNDYHNCLYADITNVRNSIVSSVELFQTLDTSDTNVWTSLLYDNLYFTEFHSLKTNRLKVNGASISDETINFDTNNIEPTQTGTVTKTSTWLWQYLTQSVNFLWLKLKDLFPTTQSDTHNYLPKIDDVNKKLVKSNLQDDGTTLSYTGNLDLEGNSIKNSGFEVVTSLPTTDIVGRQVTYQGRSYIWNGSAWKNDSDTLGGNSANYYIHNDDIIQNTNPFGGRKLYINTLDNALAAADKKYFVIITIHKKNVGGVTYPKPINAGNILLPQWEDSPVVDNISYAASSLFDNNYEGGIGIPADSYAKIRINWNQDGTSIFYGYPYGFFYLSYYYDCTPDLGNHIRLYNTYSPQGEGYRKYDLYNYIGDTYGYGYVQQVDEGYNYGLRELEFIVFGKLCPDGVNSTVLTQIEWKLERPYFASHSPLFTNYGSNKTYYPFRIGTNLADNITLNPDGTIISVASVVSNETINFDTNNIEPTQSGNVTKTSTWLWQYLTQSINWLRTTLANHNHNTTYLGINAKAADSDKLDGNHASDFATSTHNHNAAYLGLTAKAADSDLLDGNHASAFATSTHNHSTTYLGISAQASDSAKLGGQLPSYYEPAFNKNNAFNKTFGTGSSDVAKGDHGHSDLHSHANKDILDEISEALTTDLKASYDGAVTSSHNHTNKTVLDALIGTNITELNALTGTNSGDETTQRIGTLINTATAKNTPIDTDMVGLMDSAASNILKKLSWLNIKDTLKTYFETYFNTLYAKLGFYRVKVGSTYITAVNPKDTIEFVAGTNVTLTPDAVGKKLTIEASGGGGGSATYREITINNNTWVISSNSSPINIGNGVGTVVNGGYGNGEYILSISVHMGTLTDPINDIDLQAPSDNGVWTLIPSQLYSNAPNPVCGTDKDPVTGLSGTYTYVSNLEGGTWTYHDQFTNKMYISSWYIHPVNGEIMTQWKRLITCTDLSLETEEITPVPVSDTWVIELFGESSSATIDDRYKGEDIYINITAYEDYVKNIYNQGSVGVFTYTHNLKFIPFTNGPFNIIFTGNGVITTAVAPGYLDSSLITTPINLIEFTFKMFYSPSQSKVVTSVRNTIY